MENAPQPVIRAPWVRREAAISLTQIIFGANVAVFLAMSMSAHSVMDFSSLDLRAWGANYGPWTLNGQWWRLVTYMFLHGGLIHIAFNMWCLWDLGALCESLYGRWTFLGVYMLTGIGAGLTSVGWNPVVLSLGASGAIFGLAGALIASFALGEFSMPGLAIRGILRSLLFFVGFNVVLGSAIGGVDNAAHIGGLLSGLVLGALIAKLAPDHDNSSRRLVVLLLGLLLTIAAGWRIIQWRGPALTQTYTAVAEKSLDRMINAGEKNVQQHPDDTSAHYALARAYLSRRRFAEGERELKRVLELQPDNLQARMVLGTVYLDNNQAQDAQEQFAALVAKDPNNEKAHAGLGDALAELHQDTAAIAEFQAAVKLDPDYGEVYFPLGVAYANTKQYDNALAMFLTARQKNGDNADLENALAEIYAAKGMTQEASLARQQAQKLSSNPSP